MGKKTRENKTIKKNKLPSISICKWITIIYILLFAFVTWNDSVAAGTKIQGEWDDYSLPIVSIINSHNIAVSIDDIRAAQTMMPEWAQYIMGYQLTGIKDWNGNELPFYCPVYSAMCVPAFLLIGPGSGEASNTFVVTNTCLLLILTLVILFFLKAEDIVKLLLVVVVTLNPVIFYLTWPSAEVCIYTMLGISIVFWYNGWHKRSAIFLSIAGMLNQTVLIFGIIMIIEYFIRMWKNRESDEKIVKLFIRNIKDILLYAASFIPAILPMIYNYCIVGRINLTATNAVLEKQKENSFDRFIAYIFDLNYGLWPFYYIIMITALVMLVFAVKRKCWRYVELVIALLLNMLLFSVMPHINCGMTGIARYNCWAATYLLSAVVLFSNAIFTKKAEGIIVKSVIFAGILYCYNLVNTYGTINAENTYYTYWYPAAERMLDKHPSLYNPLHSTFNSRTMHVDGGITYETPIVYSAQDGYVRKILATDKDKEFLMNSIYCGDHQEWFEKQVNKLGDDESYISVPGKYQLVYYYN